MLRVSRNAHGLTLRARYTYAHAMDWNPDETSQVSGPSVLDPIDFRQEYGTSALDVRHSATAAVIIRSPWKFKNLAGHIANGLDAQQHSLLPQRPAFHHACHWISGKRIQLNWSSHRRPQHRHEWLRR